MVACYPSGMWNDATVARDSALVIETALVNVLVPHCGGKGWKPFDNLIGNTLDNLIYWHS